MVIVSFYTREPPEDVYFFLYTFHTFLRISYLMCFPLHVQTFSNIRPRHVSPASCSQRTCLAKVSLILRARIDDAVAARHGARERSWPKKPKDSGGPPPPDSVAHWHQTRDVPRAWDLRTEPRRGLRLSGKSGARSN